MLMRSRRIQWNGCRVHDAASGLWSGSSITGEPRRGAVVCYRVVGSPYGWLMDRQYVKVYNYLKYNDMKIQVELNLEDVFEEAVYNEATLKEEFTSSVRLAVVRELKEKFKNELMREISNPISEKIEDIARESISDLIENASEKKYRFRLDYMDDELTVDEFIRGRMKKVVDGGVGTMIESRAKSFVDELRKRYDMAFATFIVDNMRKQNMLKDEKIAELLKDNPDER